MTTIPQGYLPVAVRDDRYGKCRVYHHPSINSYFLSVNGKILGPLNVAELRNIRENVDDVLELRGRYVYLDIGDD
jgi:hypothetical protein